MDITELALVDHRVAELHRDAQASRRAAAARAHRTDRTAPASRTGAAVALRRLGREAVDRAVARVHALRPATADVQACCA